VSARCSGPQLGFTLDEPAQGALVVRLTFQPTGVRSCYRFGGVVVRDAPGVFQAKNAPAPAECS